MVNKYFKAFLLFSCVFLSSEVYAQLPPPPPGDLPIDSGIVGLLVLGIGYAIKKIHDNSKR